MSIKKLNAVSLEREGGGVTVVLSFDHENLVENDYHKQQSLTPFLS